MSAKSDQLRSRPAVLLLVATGRGYGQQVLEGITDYLEQNQPWRCLSPQDLEKHEAWVSQRGWADGVIAMLPAWELGPIEAMGIPAVVVQEGESSLPHIYPDDAAEASMAAEYLASLGLRDLGFAGLPGVPFSERLRAAFARVCGDMGKRMHTYDGLVNWEPDEQEDHTPRLQRWIEALPKPAGVFAANLGGARRILDACWDSGVKVPDQVAVLAIENDEVQCRLATPPLSALDQNAYRIGYRGAQLLNELMAGAPAPTEPILIPPSRVVVRRSTEILAVDNPLVADAIRRVREQACEGVDVAGIVEQVPMSKRGLELAFKRSIGRTVHQEITRLRLDRARQLLIDTDYSLAEISVRSGFSYPSSMHHIFKKATGMTPIHFRREHRAR